MAGKRVGRLAVNREAGLGIAAAEALRDVTEDAVVEVVAAQRRIAARGENFEDSARELEKRDVERAAAEIVDLANEKMDNQFRENVVFTLADHIDFSVQRYRKNINIKLPLFYEVRQLYPKESEIGKQALNILKKRLDIALPREEAAAIALHFVNYKAQAETTPDIDYGSIIEQATGIIEQELQVTVDRDSFNYYRFVTHMHYMMKRTLDDAMIDTQNRDIFESMKKEYPSIYSCSVKVAALIEQQLKKSLSEEEILYLILHINRLCAREDCDR